MFNNEDGNGWQWLSIKYIKFSCGSERPCCTTYWKASSPVAPAHPPSPPTEIRRNHRARGPKAMTGQEVTHEAGARHPKTDWGWRIVTLTKTLSKKTVARIIHCRPSSSSDVCPCDLQVRSKPMPSSPHKLSNHQSQVSAMLRILNAILTSDNMEAVTQACDSNNVRPMSLQSCQMLFGLSEHQHLVAVFFYAGAPENKVGLTSAKTPTTPCRTACLELFYAWFLPYKKHNGVSKSNSERSYEQTKSLKELSHLSTPTGLACSLVQFLVVHRSYIKVAHETTKNSL